jgi:hypothetical protein
MNRILKDIDDVLTNYPGLSRVKESEYVVVSGIFTAHSDDGSIAIADYDIKITLKDNYPYSFPFVAEIGNKILPKNETRHINPDGTLCLGNPVDEARVCRSGITLVWFLENIVNPHLCREYVRDKTGSYITGERSHGVEGLWESYYEIFTTTDKKYILEELEAILSDRKIKRNDLCYCNGAKKYKNCHLKIEDKVLDVGRDRLQDFFNQLKGSIR